jgi:hypothetical protein
MITVWRNSRTAPVCRCVPYSAGSGEDLAEKMGLMRRGPRGSGHGMARSMLAEQRIQMLHEQTGRSSCCQEEIVLVNRYESDGYQTPLQITFFQGQNASRVFEA